jgi:hypothetical protein
MTIVSCSPDMCQLQILPDYQNDSCRHNAPEYGKNYVLPDHNNAGYIGLHRGEGASDPVRHKLAIPRWTDLLNEFVYKSYELHKCMIK